MTPVHRHARRAIVLCLALAPALLPAVPVKAQAGGVPSVAGGALKGPLGEPYVDGSFGFSIRAPAATTIVREKRPLSMADVEIVRFVNPDEQLSLIVRQSNTTRPLAMDEIGARLTSRMQQQQQDVRPLASRPMQVASREGLLHVVSFHAEEKDWLRQQVVVRTDTTQYDSLIMLTPLTVREAAQKQFDQIVKSFQIVRSDVQRQRIETALGRGADLMAKARRLEIRLSEKAAPKDRYMRFILKQKEQGYVQIRERADVVMDRKGLRILEEGWLFRPDGGITRLAQDMFIADDLSCEAWENSVVTLSPPDQRGVRVSTLDRDGGAREGDHLMLAFTPVPGAPRLEKKDITTDRTYAAMAWHPVLPRLLDLGTPELYAFSSYNPDRRGLSLRTIQVVGVTQTPLGGGRTMPLYKLEDSEGLIPPVSEINADGAGQIIRVAAGDLEMIATTPDYIEGAYSKKVKEARDLLARFQPRPPELEKDGEEKPHVDALFTDE